MTKRHIELPPGVQDTIDQTIGEIDARLATEAETAVVVQEVLADLFGDWDAYERYRAGESLPPLTRMRIESYDPRNAFVESERWAEQDHADLRTAKCLQYLWRGFDLSPLANNIAFALPFRQMLANHLFEECGDNCRFFKGISMTYGHNISVGDNVVVHDDVHLDDRGKLTIGDRASISDDSHIYSHRHDTVDQTEVTNYHTIIEDDVRLTYDSMVQAGVRVGPNALLAPKSIAGGDIPAHHIAAGSPAESVGVKSGWESVAEPAGTELVDNREQRRISYEISDDVEVFDEFQRELSPPDH